MPHAVTCPSRCVCTAAAIAGAIALGGAGRALASPLPRAATEPAIHPTLPWAAAQLVPSPEWEVAGDAVYFGVRWQIVPALYSFGINRRLSPWRALIVEPLVRHAGSLELFVSPEYIVRPSPFERNWLFRAGLRAYFPLADHGEYLSTSIGGSAIYDREQIGTSYEAGLYTLSGLLGVQVTYTPTEPIRSTTFTLSLRAF